MRYSVMTPFLTSAGNGSHFTVIVLGVVLTNRINGALLGTVKHKSRHNFTQLTKENRNLKLEMLNKFYMKINKES